MWILIPGQTLLVAQIVFLVLIDLLLLDYYTNTVLVQSFEVVLPPSLHLYYFVIYLIKSVFVLLHAQCDMTTAFEH